MSIHWTILPFGQLSTFDLHDALRLRCDVFVVEQRCIYPEVDGQDTTAWHILGRTHEGRLAAYARILPGTPPHIGRVVVDPAFRGKGLAEVLMHQAMTAVERLFGSAHTAVAAQTYLEPFYARLGFVRQGPDYDWDGIPHVDMVLPA